MSSTSERRRAAGDVLVGLMAEPGPDLLVGLVGILRSGGGFVPLDPAHPVDRLALVARECGLETVVTEGRFKAKVDRLAESSPKLRRVILLDGGIAVEDGAGSAAEAAAIAAGEEAAGDAEGLAYVIYTSGSTGLPKGVPIRHRNLVPILRWGLREFDLGEHTRILQSLSYGFDFGVFELLTTLLAGGEIVFPGSGERADVARFARDLSRYRANTVHTTPSYLQALLGSVGSGDRLASLSVLHVGGEQLSAALVDRVHALNARCSVWNGYGPTEASVNCCVFRAGTGPEERTRGLGVVPIGGATAENAVYVLDGRLRPAGRGESGELAVGGAGLSSGYLGRAGLTAARFVPDPLAAGDGAGGSRLYLTGDVVRLRGDGELEFRGRLDQQLKVRGFRIEPGEVEALLSREPGVQESVVVASGGSLVAYYVAGARRPEVAQLRASLRRQLPGYMVPGGFVEVEALPRTASGKLDREALARGGGLGVRGESSYVAPRTPVEEVIAGIWRECLGVERVGVEDNFFDLGGHSLLGMQVISHLRKSLGVEVSLRSFFESSTLGELARSLEASRRSELPAIERVSREGDHVVSFAQERLWFLAQLDPASKAYHVPRVVHAEGPFDGRCLEEAYRGLLARHEILRTVFPVVDGVPVQRILPVADFHLPEVDLRRLDPWDLRETSSSLEWSELRRGFDLERGPMLRAVVLRQGAQERLLIQSEHHLVHDGWTQGVMLEELLSRYQGLREGRPVEYPALRIQYADFASWQRRWLVDSVLASHLEYWRGQLEGMPSLLDLPTDRPRPSVQSFAGWTRWFDLPYGLLEELQRFSRRRGTTLFMTLVGSFQTLLSRYSGVEDVVIGTPIANRQHVETEQLLGFFVNTLVLRTRLSLRMSFEELLEGVRETTLGAYAHQDMPFEKLVEALEPARDLGHVPLCQVMFILQNAPVPALELPDLHLRQKESHNGTSKFDLTLNLQDRGGRFFGWLEYSTALFDSTTMDRLLVHFERLLGGVVSTPDRALQDVELLGDSERHQVQVESNDVSRSLTGLDLLERFAAVSETTPDSPALIHGSAVLSYGELKRRVEILGRRLRSAGAGPERRVAVFLDPGLDVVTSLLALQWVGAAYVPLEPSYPAERTGYIVEDAEVSLVLTVSGRAGSLPPGHDATLLLLDAPAEELGEDGEAGPAGAQAENLAYVIYTSGSTGRPKGVEIARGALWGFLGSMYREPGMRAGERLLSCTTVSFDIAALEYYLPLYAGGTAVLVDREVAADGRRLAGELERQRVEVLQATPATWRLLLDGGWRGDGRLRAFCGGEALSLRLAGRLLAGCGEVWNLYGPTETTIWSSARRVSPGAGGVDLGGPIDSTSLYVVGGGGRLVPLGVAGELTIGGAHLGRGYRGRAGLTAERFVPDPWSVRPGERLYRTGDVVRRRPAGALEFLGRLDHQVKVRGFRIELGEVEAVLSGHPSVSEAVVGVSGASDGDGRLVAYVVASEDAGDARESVALWSSVWEETYRGEAAGDVRFDLAGWTSSYTGAALSDEVMREWVEETVRRVEGLGAERVLEIGCGTGLLLYRLAGGCSAYWGTDVSPAVLSGLRRGLASLGAEYSHVRLLERPAHELDGLEGERFDLVILNSVVQYFPSGEYLAEVLVGASKLLAPGGRIFVGDVRHLSLLESFRTAVVLARSPSAAPLERVRAAVDELLLQEKELVLDPRWFAGWVEGQSVLGGVEVWLKRGRHHSELMRYRSDVVLGPARADAPADVELDWRREDLDLERLERRLGAELAAGLTVAVRRIPNARVAGEHIASELLRDSASELSTVGGLRTAARDDSSAVPVDPEDLWELCERLGARGAVTWCAAPVDACDLLVAPAERERPAAFPSGDPGAAGPWINDPARAVLRDRLEATLREYLGEYLPGYMVPSTFVVLDELPKTPNNKVDRRALRALDRGRATPRAAYVPPRTSTEETLAGLWRDLLERDPIGVRDDFFALGGHSLVATRLISRVRGVFGVELELREFFAVPTIEALARRLGDGTSAPGGAELPVLRPVPRDEDLPLSFAQERLWFLEQLDGGHPAYHLAGGTRLAGWLDAGALRRAFGSILERHEALRTRFPARGGVPRQVIEPPRPVSVPEVDLAGLSAGERERELERLSADLARRRFDLAAGNLVRALLARLEEEEHAFVFVLHHIVADGWSFGVLFRELAALYDAYSAGRGAALPELEVQYADYAVWQRRWLRDEVLAEQIEYWRGRLEGVPAVLELPTDRPRPARQSYRGGRLPATLSSALTRRLSGLGRSRGATLFMVLLASFQALLGRWSGVRDLAVGSPIAGRRLPEIEPLIGFFVNTLVLRSERSPGESFASFLGRLRDTVLEDFMYQDVPFERLVEELVSERDPSHTPLVQVALALQNASASPVRHGGLALEPLEVDTGATQFDVQLSLEERDGGLRGTVGYNRDLFDGVTIRRLIDRYRRLLERVSAEPERSLDSLDLLGSGERHQLCVEGNDASARRPWDGDLVSLLGVQISARPEAVAMVSGSRAWSYGELGRRGAELASVLARAGARAGVPVGVCLERSAELVETLVGILTAGCWYVPLDPSHPLDRLGWMIEDAGIGIVVSGRSGSDPWLDADDGTAAVSERWGDLVVRRLRGSGGAAPAATPAVARRRPASIACTLYTSGSTGLPKGIALHHRGIARLAVEANYVDLVPGRRFAHASNPAFDATTLEVWGTLLSGGCLVVLPAETVLSPERLSEELPRLGIEYLFLTTALVHEVARRVPGAFGSLRALLFGGEAADARWLRRVFEAGAPGRVINLYGPAEGTTLATWHRLRRSCVEGWTVPIGRPVTETRVYVADGELRQVPMGAVGELLVGGAGLARGYLGRASLTAERFVPGVFSGIPGARHYRTGDLVRWGSSGALEFVGRSDFQVKVRGFRIELEEIEAVVCEHGDVAQAVVLARRDRGGDPRLAAYCVPAEGTAWDSGAVAGYARSRLPSYMVPSAWVRLDTLPLTSNGKIDRGALPAPPSAGVGRDAQAARTPVEELIAGIWCEVLGLESVGVTDDFFELGGHSLLATRVVSHVSKALEIELPLIELFSAPTVAALAAEIEKARLGVARTPPAPPLTAGAEADGEEGWPLSFAQERLWFLDRFEPAAAAYNVPLFARLSGPLDPRALSIALAGLAARHETLRTRIESIDGEPRQRVADPLAAALPAIDLTGLVPAAAACELERWSAAEATRPFDLGTCPLTRWRLWRLAGEDHAVLGVLHHIVSDGWSLGVVVRELSELYSAASEGRRPRLPELPLQYRDFASWQRRWLRGERLHAEMDFWRERLAGAPPFLDLPIDRPRPVVQSYRGHVEKVALPRDLVEKLRRFCGRARATLYMTLLAGFQVLLGRWTGQRDLVLGTPIANRTRAELEGLVGFFVNTLVLRGNLEGDPSFELLVDRVRAGSLAAYAHQDLPFEKLVEEIQPPRDPSRPPLVQVLFGLQNAPLARSEFSGLDLVPVPIEGRTSKFELSVLLGEAGGEVAGIVEYSDDLFDATTVRRLMGQWKRLLAAAIAHPERVVGDLEMVSAVERQQLLIEWNDAAGPAAARWLHELFIDQSLATPDAVALIAGEAQLSYRTLRRRAGALARRLRAEGIGREQRVGILLERSPELVTALIAVLEAGGAYVPLEPELPEARLRYLIDDSGVEVVLTRVGLLERLGPGERPIVVDRPEPESPSPRLPPVPLRAESLIYTLYTSGSTGRPKGVMNHHGGLANRVAWMRRSFELGAEDRVIQKTPFSFDVSVWEVFWPLSTGAGLVIAEPEGHRDPAYLIETMVAQRVTAVHFVPSMLGSFLHHPGASTCRSLRQAFASGEALTPDLVDRFADVVGVPLNNLYGPTEASIEVSWWRARTVAGPDVPIGRPIANLRLDVLDRRGRPVPAGVAGELHIGGVAVARGYHGRPALTAELFVPDACAGKGARIYRTGDAVRRRADGEIEFLGRLDFQVKLRGVRIELGEVEAVLAEHPAVLAAAAVMRDDPSGYPALMAYVSLVPGASQDPGELRRFSAQRLPQGTVPSRISVLRELPKTASGKVDRKALPELDWKQAPGRGAAPRTPVEEAIAGLWAEVLGRDEVGVQDDFFELGGHSLLATRLTSRVASVFGVELPLAKFFTAPTVAELARQVDAARGAGLSAVAPPVHRQSRLGDMPLSFAQRRLWFLDKLVPGDPAYNMPFAVSMKGRLEQPVLAAALAAVIRRHESLRTRFCQAGGEPVQRIDPPWKPELHEVDLDHLAVGERERAFRQVLRVEAARPFDLLRGPLLRAVVVRRSSHDHVFLLTLHHIVADGWSIGILMRELSQLYTAGTGADLPVLPVQYADYAVWQRRWLDGEVLDRQLDYWLERLAGVPLLELPVDRPRGRVSTKRASVVSAVSPAELGGHLRRLARSSGATFFMAVLAGFAALLARLSGQRDFAVGAPIANRTRVEIEDLIGFFTNTLALRLDLSEDPSFSAVIERARSVALGAYDHQEVPFEKLVEELQPERRLDAPPLFQMMLAVQDVPLEHLEWPDLEIEPLETASVAAKFDLLLAVTEGPAGIRWSLEYNQELFDPATAERYLRYLETLVADAAARPESRLSGLALLGVEERAEIVAGAYGPALGPAPATLGELFRRRAIQASDAVAVIDRSGDLGSGLTAPSDLYLSYGELARRARESGRRLRALGVGPEVSVGLCAERSAALIVALLGIYEAGGVCLPLDTGNPPARLKLLLEEARPRIVLVDRVAGARLEASLLETGPRFVDLGARGAPADRADGEGDLQPPPGELAGEQLAYLIYTSGSTGRPKGVAMCHRAVARLLAWQRERTVLGAPAVTLQFTPLVFDVSFQEIFSTFDTGGSLVLIAESLRRDPALLCRRLCDWRIERLYLPFVALNQISEVSPRGYRMALRDVVTAGEQLQVTPSLIELFQGLGARLHNHYGPSETHVVTAHELRGDPAGWPRLPAIGLPVASSATHLLDAALEPVPSGAVGEICLGGEVLGRGYLGRSATTAERFVPDPFAAAVGGRLYRTGDLGRRSRPGAEVQFLGRRDHQLKIRGFRVEPGEIEAALRGHPDVGEAIVVARGDRAGHSMLVGYVAPRNSRAVSLPELRRYLEERLPDYMVPAAIVPVDAFDLTETGKVDRRSLPEIDREQIEVRPYAPPRTDLERRLAEIWEELLDLDRVGVDDDFFELGGHSLLATRLQFRLREESGVEFPLADFFRRPTLAALASTLELHAAGVPGRRLETDLPDLAAGASDAYDLPQDLEELSAEELLELLGEVEAEF